MVLDLETLNPEWPAKFSPQQGEALLIANSAIDSTG